MESNQPGVVLVVGADLLGRTRIEQAIERSGFTPRSPSINKLSEVDISGVRAIFADVDSDEVMDAVFRLDTSGKDVLKVGYFAHVDRTRADRVKAAGWEAMPRGRLFRELPALLEKL
jgi:hypothetical protein